MGTQGGIGEKLIKVHSLAEGSHSGYLGTYSKMKAYFFWHGMKATIKALVKQCDVCQRNKSENQAPARLLQPLPIPNQARQHVTMDFIEGLSKSEG